MNQKNVISYILMTWLKISILGENCDDIKCSNIFDEVCGIAVLNNRTRLKLTFQNVCFMKKAECEEKSFVEVYQVDNELCDLKQRMIAPENDDNEFQSRRVHDFSIVGAHRVCNHSCPTFCIDIYAPACAQIWHKNLRMSYKTMLNHCHIDLFSCTTGLNVTIHALSKCFSNPSGLLFMQNMAAMKSLKFLDDSNRRAYEAASDEDSETTLNTHLKEILGRIIGEYSISLDQDESQ